VSRPRVCRCGCGARLPKGRRRWASDDCSRRGVEQNRPEIGTQRTAADGRVWIYQPDHPCARKDGWALRHRLLAHDQLTGGRARCVNCRRQFARFAALKVIHLNGVLGDDHIDNLFAGCEPCARIVSIGVWLDHQPWLSATLNGSDAIRALAGLARELAQGVHVGDTPQTDPLRGSAPGHPDGAAGDRDEQPQEVAR